MTERDAEAVFAAYRQNVLHRISARDARLGHCRYSLQIAQLRSYRYAKQLKLLCARNPLEYESRTKVIG